MRFELAASVFVIPFWLWLWLSSWPWKRILQLESSCFKHLSHFWRIWLVTHSIQQSHQNKFIGSFLPAEQPSSFINCSPRFTQEITPRQRELPKDLTGPSEDCLLLCSLELSISCQINSRIVTSVRSPLHLLTLKFKNSTTTSPFSTF